MKFMVAKSAKMKRRSAEGRPRACTLPDILRTSGEEGANEMQYQGPSSISLGELPLVGSPFLTRSPACP